MISPDQDPRRQARADPEDPIAKERARIADAREGQEPDDRALEAAVQALHPDRVFFRSESTRKRFPDGGLELTWTYVSTRGRYPDREDYDREDRRDLLAVHLSWSTKEPVLRSRTEKAERDIYGRT